MVWRKVTFFLNMAIFCIYLKSLGCKHGKKGRFGRFGGVTSRLPWEVKIMMTRWAQKTSYEWSDIGSPYQ